MHCCSCKADALQLAHVLTLTRTPTEGLLENLRMAMSLMAPAGRAGFLCSVWFTSALLFKEVASGYKGDKHVTTLCIHA